MMTLEEIGMQLGTDQYEHGYLTKFAELFGPLRSQPITICEIGTWRGASVKMWADFFQLGKIVGIDHSPEWMPGPDDTRITVEIGKQEDRQFQDDFGRRHGPFDIVIDDGGHKPHQHLISLDVLWPFVKPGGWYAIEDLHSLFNPCWTAPGEPTILDWIYQQGRAVLVGGSDVAEIQIVGGNWNDGLVFLRKRRDDERYTPEHPAAATT